MSSRSAPPSSRTPGIDLARLLASFAIVLIHAEPFRIYPDGFERYLHLFINQASRFAVPCFFFLAGYFWGKKLAGTPLGPAFRAYGGRILAIFLFWSVVYAALPDPHLFQDHTTLEVLQHSVAGLERLVNKPVQFLLQGTAAHLWFLPALLSAVLLAAVGLRLELPHAWLLTLGAGLYAFGLLAGSYAHTRWGIATSFNTRDGPFFATLPFMLGWWMSRSDRSVSLAAALSLLLGGFGLQLLESFLLWRCCETPAAAHDYWLGTLPFGVGVGLLALARPSVGSGSRWTKYGRYALGIYAIHYLFVDHLPMPDALLFSPAGQLLFPVVVFALALATAAQMSKVPWIRRFVA